MGLMQAWRAGSIPLTFKALVWQAAPLGCRLGAAAQHEWGDPSAHPGSAGTARTKVAELAGPESVNGMSPA